MPASIVLRLEHPLFFDAHPDVARRIADILVRPCFSALSRLCARQRGGRWVKYTKVTAALLAEYLLEPANDGISLDSGRSGELVASALVSNGQLERNFAPSSTRLDLHVVIPWEPEQGGAVIESFCDLAVAIDARSGATTIEPNYAFGEDFGLAMRPKVRRRLSEQRWQERRARRRYEDHIATQLAGPEWGVFLGPGHLDHIDVETLRSSGVFGRVMNLAPTLVFLQLTNDPADSLIEGFEAKLDEARKVLAPILMDLSEVTLD